MFVQFELELTTIMSNVFQLHVCLFSYIMYSY